MNKVFLTANLTRQPELKLTPSGVKVCNFGLASNERWNDAQTGEQRESVTFVECEAWNRTAESIFEYFKKGDPILIEGSLRFDSWESEGQNRNRLKVRVQRWEFMRQRLDNDSETGTAAPETTHTPTDAEPQTQASSDEKPPF